MPRVYVSHAYRGDPGGNAAAVARLARRLALEGALPIAPQIYLPAFLDEATERDLALKICLEMIGLADEVRVYGPVTEGMSLEVARARALGIPIVDATQKGGTGAPESLWTRYRWGG